MRIIEDYTTLDNTCPMSWHKPFLIWWYNATHNDENVFIRTNVRNATKKLGKPNHVSDYDDSSIWIFEHKNKMFYLSVNDHEGHDFGYFADMNTDDKDFTEIITSCYTQLVNILNNDRKDKLERILS